MKKNLIALSLSLGGALLCATGAQAQSSVQLMGLTDVFVGSMKNAGDAGSSKVVNSGGMTTSWFGFKGTEDLGGGLGPTLHSPRSSRWTAASRAASPTTPSSRAMPTWA